jgi:hypothetical protein
MLRASPPGSTVKDLVSEFGVEFREVGFRSSALTASSRVFFDLADLLADAHRAADVEGTTGFAASEGEHVKASRSS